MKYELLKSNRGVLVDRSSVFCDIKGSVELSFLLPDKGEYVAVIIDSHGTTFRMLIDDGKLELPVEVMTPQLLQLYVVKAEEGQITATYACEPIKIQSLSEIGKNVFEITGAATEDDLRLRMTEIEKQFCTQVQKFEQAREVLTVQIEKYNEAIKRFNVSVETINRLSERLAALEANYDPTVIE